MHGLCEFTYEPSGQVLGIVDFVRFTSVYIANRKRV